MRIRKRGGDKANRTEKERGNEMVIECECLREEACREMKEESGSLRQLQILNSTLGERGSERKVERGAREKIGKKRQKKRKGKKERTYKSVESVVHLFN